MNRQDAVVCWEDYSTEWAKDWIAEQEDTGEGFDIPCPQCGNGTLHRNPQEAAEQAWCDYGAERQWEDFVNDLTQLLDAMNPNGEFHVQGRNMGWMHQEGYKDVFLYGEHKPSNKWDSRGQAFLRAISPNTDCHYWIWAVNEQGEEFNPFAVAPYPAAASKLIISLSEHDGTASYEVIPLKEEEEEEDD